VRRLDEYPYNRRLATNPEPVIETYTPTSGLWSGTPTARKWRDDPLLEAIRSNIGVPLVVRDRIIGGMTIDSHQPGRYTAQDAETAMAFARQAATAIENARLYGAERAAREQAERLRAATQALSATMDLPQVLKVILSELQRVVPCDSASVQELQGRRLVVVGGHGFPNLQAVLGMSFDLDDPDNPNREVVRTRAPVVIEDGAARYKSFLSAAGAGIRSWLGVPLLFGDRLIGMLTLDRKEAGFYTAEHARLAVSFAAQAAIALENARLYTSAQQELAERKRAERDEALMRVALEGAATMWELTFNAIESPILILDLQGRIVRLNRAAETLAGSPKEPALPGRPLRELATEEPWRNTVELVEAIGEARSASHCQVRDEAAAKTWDITVSYFAGAGAESGHILAVIRDVTRMAELQDSLRRSETMSAMGRLVAGVAHEVRNPLFGIAATLDAFEARFAGEAGVRDYLAALRAQIGRMNDLMQELLDYGKPVIARFAQDSIAAAIDDAIQLCAGLAARSSIDVTREIPAGLPQVMMDKRRIVQVFQNLLQNAIQHSRRGGRVEIQAAAERPWVRCWVRDSGAGIPVEDLSRVFEPFFTRRRGGTGLGLSIVQRVIEEHGGRVAVANHPEGGALATVWLPGA
jgi:PAS domain S-box-containing protein